MGGGECACGVVKCWFIATIPMVDWNGICIVPSNPYIAGLGCCCRNMPPGPICELGACIECM